MDFSTFAVCHLLLHPITLRVYRARLVTPARP